MQTAYIQKKTIYLCTINETHEKIIFLKQIKFTNIFPLYGVYLITLILKIHFF